MKQNLTKKIILIFASTLLFVFAALTTVIQVSNSTILDRYIVQNIYSTQSNIDVTLTGVFDECVYLQSRILGSDNISKLNLIADPAASREEKVQAFEQVLNDVGVGERYFVNVACEINDEYFFLNGENSIDAELLRSASSNRNQLILGNCSELSPTLAIGVRDVSTSFDGVFFYYMNSETIGELISVFEDGYSFVMREDGYLIAHFDPAYIGKSAVYSDVYNLKKVPSYTIKKVDGKRSIVVIKGFDKLNLRYGFGLYIVTVLDYATFYREIISSNLILLGVALAMFVILILLGIWQTKRVSAPIVRLNDDIGEMIENGTATPHVKHDEIDQLGVQYDMLMDRIFALIAQNNEDMEKQRKLELDALQMQINPHFLYNTLDIISWIAKMKKQPELETLVLNLAGFYRLSLHKGDKFITVEDEINIVKHYLQIEKISHPGRVTAFFEVEEGIKGEKVLKLILQPMVENVTKYAFPETGGNLYVRAFSEGDDIVFEVEDDGVGFEVADDILSPKEDGLHGYGVYNVHKRIQLEYGEDHGVSIFSEPKKGTLCRIRVKKLPEDGAGDAE